MINLTKAYKIDKEKLNEALKALKNQEILGVYGVIASRIDNIHKCDLLMETEEDLLVFGDELWNEPFFGSWTEDKEEYLYGGADVLVKQIK